MLSKDLETTLNSAFKGARNKRHEFMTVEHLLLALLDNEIATSVLSACDCDLPELRNELAEFVDSTTPLFPRAKPAGKRSQHSAFNVCFSVRSFTFSPRENERSQELTYWSRSSLSRRVKRCSS